MSEPRLFALILVGWFMILIVAWGVHTLYTSWRHRKRIDAMRKLYKGEDHER